MTPPSGHGAVTDTAPGGVGEVVTVGGAAVSAGTSAAPSAPSSGTGGSVGGATVDTLAFCSAFAGRMVRPSSLHDASAAASTIIPIGSAMVILDVVRAAARIRPRVAEALFSE